MEFWAVANSGGGVGGGSLFFFWVFLVSLFLHPGLGFWAVANSGDGCGVGFIFLLVFLVSLFLHPGLGFWAMANNGGGVGDGSLEPYKSMLGSLPADCLGQHIWRSIVPLIHFWVVEDHHPKHVLRQFRMKQGIPVNVDTSTELHKITLQGKLDRN
ncbi:serine/threonine-protein phosphatase 7 long form like protein [Quercus suber]|uniref:Serine/threonine-protein phosphatase 7 long form like protein n=1 Tax=Quercus suber TaxID=58331 RepID=A0AAW0MBC0_QUESU